MKIIRVVIKNYRSIKSIAFNPAELTAFVGPNNAGKTNILSALNFLLGERFPMPAGLDINDYYGRDQNADIQISAWFAQDAQGNPNNIEYVSFCTLNGTDSLKARYKIFGVERPSWLNNDVRESCSLVYLDAGRSYESSFGQSKWSLFGKIVRQLGDNFSATVDEPTRAALLGHLDSAHHILKTPLYLDFERRVKEAFEAQLRGTTHSIGFDFRTFDPLNFYKSLYPTLVENGSSKNPSEAGSGMRNLIVLALFRAYAESFRGNAIIAIEEPEIYLHPHAQRSLNALFETLTAAGAQLFMSTHSGAFLAPERSDRVVLVKQMRDEEDDLCTQIKHVPATELLRIRQTLFPTMPMTVESMQERYRNLCTADHCEAFFASFIVLVEGPTEKAALPVYAQHLGLDLNSYGISVVSAGGKGNLDSFFHLYNSLEIPVYTIFDNDRTTDGRTHNPMLCRMLGIPETPIPDGIVADRYCIFEGDYETTMSRDLAVSHPGWYDTLRQNSADVLGSAGKAIVARYMARQLVTYGVVPTTMRNIVTAIERIVRRAPVVVPLPPPLPAAVTWADDDDDDISF
jgi:putative ATP-dependent endonuclease of the OLD family